MDVTDLVADIIAIVGFAVAIIGGLLVARTAKESKTSEIWREEAEAQKARADRLHDDLSEIKEVLAQKMAEPDEIREQLSRIEDENKRLLSIVSAIGPGISDPDCLTLGQHEGEHRG